MAAFSIALIIIMTWCLQRAAAAIADLAAGWRRWILERTETETAPLVAAHFALALTDPSPLAQRTQGLLWQALRLRTWRANLMQICFADVALWLMFLAGLLLFQVGGFFLLAVGAFFILLAMTPWKFPRPAAGLFISLGFFLIAAEIALRLNGATPSENVNGLTMWLADNRPLAVFTVTIASLIITAITGAEFLGFTAALVGLASGVLSLNGAVGLVWGERIGLSLRLFIEGRAQIKSIKQMKLTLLMADLIAWPVAFLLLGYTRDFVAIAAPTPDELLYLLMDFLFLTAVTLLPFVLGSLLLGHFQGKKVPQDLMDVSVLPTAWLRATSLRPSLVPYLVKAVQARQDEISRLRMDFEESEWAKVPPAVRQASELEARHLRHARQFIETHLLSRSDFFDHQLR